ncbi:hypothetical protein SAMN02745671_01018 [Anaerovibrio lipolyticus DSM 3074]|uniref:Uncharacterized protein n=1 Tax=Anaerovibrio lipolyticus DSM 3074 TaxID=1120997 RepID=A0A1M6C5Z6_9FIRM|nr:zinc ribbon domain-containing protein [Anaerovibrio lipolyticus]SHI56436.1 hypothetical protein SAMN02745671_01018 [Anaerovibrio lipolyticus DSM 3074]
MKVLINRRIPQIYTAVSRNAPGVKSAYEECRYQEKRFYAKFLYKCLKCKSDFEVYHRYIPTGSYYCRADDEVVTCPVCGFKHKNFANERNIFFDKRTGNKESWVPKEMFLEVREIKDEIILGICAESYALDDKADKQVFLHEEFRFNVKKRQTMFITWNNGYRAGKKVYELGNPLDKWIFENSVLWHLRSDNLSKAEKSDILKVVKYVRDAVRKKWKKCHKHELSGIYASYGQENGYMLFGLVNIAFRLVYSDAGNLPQWLNTVSPSEIAKRCFSNEDKVFAK